MDVHGEQLIGEGGAAALLNQAVQHIEAARMLLAYGYDSLSPDVSEVRATAARLEAMLPTLLRAPNMAHASPVPSPRFREPRGASPVTQGAPYWSPSARLVERVNARFGLTGVACARVLLYLAEHRNRMVPVGELAAAVELRARSTAVIKVYVCRLRKAFVQHGFSPDMLETGAGSYAFRSALHPVISDMIQQG